MEDPCEGDPLVDATMKSEENGENSIEKEKEVVGMEEEKEEEILCPRLLREIVSEICLENKLSEADVDEIWKPFERNWVYTIENFRANSLKYGAWWRRLFSDSQGIL